MNKISEQPRNAQYSQTKGQYQSPAKTFSLQKDPIKINDLLKHSKYILPFIFVIDTQIVKKNFAQLHANNRSEVSVKCQGTLAYENGCPLSLKQFRFCVLPYSTKLNRFFYIHKKTYQIKFNFETSAHYNNEEQLHGTINKELEKKINEGKQSLINFLSKIGLISSKEKSVNRYRTILMAEKAKKKMHEIIEHLHGNQQGKEDNFLRIEQNYKKSQECQNKVRSEITACQEEIKIEQKKRYPECSCSKQQRCDKAYYTQVQFEDCPIQKVCEIKIKDDQKKYACDGQVGGYFSVKCYNAQIKIQDQQNNIKIALKQLNSQYRDIQKYKSKIEHQINIIKNINKRKNKYVCSYFILDKQDSSMKVGTSHQSKALSNDKIVMEELLLNLKQILSNEIYCNFFEVVKELLKAVQALHSNGIIHRDIKPANIMFNAQGHLKLIDFSESIQCWKDFNENTQKNADVGYTMPYSPLQCMKVCREGYSNMKIDNYEVGMTILEIILGYLPVSYCKSLIGVIKNGWATDQFHYCMSLRSNNLNNCLLLPLKILCIKLMDREAKKRLCIDSVLGYLLHLQQQFFYLK